MVSNELPQRNRPKTNIGDALTERLKELSGANKITSSVDMTSERADLMKRSQSSIRGTVWALLDTSISMEDSPLRQAKSGLEQFARDAIAFGFQVGIIAFDSSAREISPAILDADQLASSLRPLVASGGTTMAEPILMATQRLATECRERIIFLVTDGQPSDRDETFAAANAARKSGIDILTLGTDSADHEFLRLIATRADLARGVANVDLETGIAQTARMLLGLSTKREK